MARDREGERVNEAFGCGHTGYLEQNQAIKCDVFLERKYWFGEQLALASLLLVRNTRHYAVESLLIA